MIAAPKQRYEHDQAEDLTELQKLYEHQAED
jgi:hypothetical protein